MDTTLSALTAHTPVLHNPAPAQLRAQTTKVHAATQVENSAIGLTSKPFVAQVVSARLSGTSFPEQSTEIAPPERTLRPYGVPMLPYEAQETANPTGPAQGSSQRTAADPGPLSSQD